jgi:hypothetical protein
MLIRFRSKVGGFSMFGDVATRLLKMLGHSGTVPGAIRAADIPNALQQLRSAVTRAGPDRPAPGPGEDQEENQPAVTLQQRAYPLIDLLERSAKEDCDVLWDKS